MSEAEYFNDTLRFEIWYCSTALIAAQQSLSFRAKLLHNEVDKAP